MKERKKREQSPPPPPKTIIVMAGSRNRSAWPVAPGVGNANVPIQIELTSGSAEYAEEMVQSRIEVAKVKSLN